MVIESRSQLLPKRRISFVCTCRSIRLIVRVDTWLKYTYYCLAVHSMIPFRVLHNYIQVSPHPTSENQVNKLILNRRRRRGSTPQESLLGVGKAGNKFISLPLQLKIGTLVLAINSRRCSTLTTYEKLVDFCALHSPREFPELQIHIISIINQNTFNIKSLKCPTNKHDPGCGMFVGHSTKMWWWGCYRSAQEKGVCIKSRLVMCHNRRWSFHRWSWNGLEQPVIHQHTPGPSPSY